ncbi:unnamed protein product [Vicia faba]|uniref:Uncharacterized protein n=1 Tax=Vicia faba TaxID=3906 RepID=A0AAV0ZLD5_VICFA|nr:unnamed protein product [Vicia faba]
MFFLNLQVKNNNNTHNNGTEKKRKFRTRIGTARVKPPRTPPHHARLSNLFRIHHLRRSTDLRLPHQNPDRFNSDEPRFRFVRFCWQQTDGQPPSRKRRRSHLPPYTLAANHRKPPPL